MAAVDSTAGVALCNRCLNWKTVDQFYRNKRSKSNRCAACKLCMDIAHSHWAAANPEKLREVTRKAHAKKREVRNAQIAAWSRKNRERVNQRHTEWRERNRALDCGYTKKWQAQNKDKVAANCAKRRTRKLQAQPEWANEFYIAEAYRLAKDRAHICGGKWHVDHIVPLRSKLVCGLHVESNLRVIPATANMRKSNRHWPDMP